MTVVELLALRRVVAQSFVSRGALSPAQRERLTSLGLVYCTLGGVMATSAGRMAAR